MISSQPDTMPATLSSDRAQEGVWDVLVVGAGPAGALAARECARLGSRVLLVDRGSFPRYKVCGGCLSAVALQVLEDVGLGDVVKTLGGQRIDNLRLAAGARKAELNLPPGLAVLREKFDAALIRCAISAGAEFLPAARADSMENTTQNAGGMATVDIHMDDKTVRIQTRVVIVAAGLGGSRLTGEEDDSSDSRVGAGAVMDSAPAFYEEGAIHMACGKAGYVGLVRLPGGYLNAAAALDIQFIKSSGGMGPAAAMIIAQCHWPEVPELSSASWRGTPSLNRQPARIASARALYVGDAAGYVEPFTGEGMAWAMAAGVAAAPFAIESQAGWSDALEQRWTARHRELLETRQRACRRVARSLRHIWWTRAVVSALSFAPGLAAPMVRRMHTPIDLRCKKAEVLS